jgi:hypothetical protein
MCDTSNELYKFNKTLYENHITRSQLKDIYETGTINPAILYRIIKFPKFSMKFDNNKILLATIMVLQNDYNSADRYKALNSIIERTATNELKKRVVGQAKSYGIFCYYKELNNDKIPLPKSVIESVQSVFNMYSSVYSVEELENMEFDANAYKIIQFLLNKKNFTYLIYDITETECVSSYIYQRLELDFPYDKTQFKINTNLVREDGLQEGRCYIKIT